MGIMIFVVLFWIAFCLFLINNLGWLDAYIKKSKSDDFWGPFDQELTDCPDDGTKLLNGPSGGMSVNKLCPKCNERFNDIGGFGYHRLGKQNAQQNP